MDKGAWCRRWRRLGVVGAGWLLGLGLSGWSVAAAVNVAAEAGLNVVAGTGESIGAGAGSRSGSAENVADEAAFFADADAAADEPSFGDEIAEWWARTQTEVLGFFEAFDDYLSRTRLLTVGELQSLPVGLQTKVGQTVCDLLVTEAVFGPDYTDLTVFLRLTTPAYEGGNLTLYFGSENVRISSQGGFVGDLKLALLSEVNIGGKGGAFRLVLDPARKRGDLPPTYAIVGCDGFEEMQINGRVVVSPEYAKPVFDGKPLENRELEIPFSCRATGLDDIMADVEVPEFALTALPDWRFEARRAVFDFSTQDNAPAMDYYRMPGVKLYDGFPEMWTGLYIEDFAVHFPAYVREGKSGSPVFAAERLWLDENGFSGVLAARDVLAFNKGSLEEWRFSVDEIDISIVANRIQKGGMKGSIGIPVSIKTNFDYEAGFKTDGSWDMKVKMGERTTFDLWKSLDVELFATSYIKVEKKAADTSVRLTANLSGKMTLDPTAKIGSDATASGASGGSDDGVAGSGASGGSGQRKAKGKFDFGEIAFSGLKVSNREPYLEIGKLELKGKAQVGNFPVSLDKIGLSVKNARSSLSFGLKVDLLTRSQNVNCAGNLDFSIASVYKPAVGETAAHWDFDGFHVDKLKVDISAQVFSIKGSAVFFEDDKHYGDGFKGELGFKMKTGLEFGLDANVMFGAMPSYRYWYADMMSNFAGAGIPVYPGFQISGIGGGAYQCMRMEPDKEGANFGERLTQTGVRYLPDSTLGMGFKAFCQLSTQAEPDLFKADLALSVGILKGGGLDHISLQGVAKFMNKTELAALADMSNRITMALEADSTKWDKMRKASTADAAFTATALLTYDHKNRSFYGLFDTYLQMGMIKGVGTDGHVGACEMYFSKPKWFVHIGHPERRLGIKMDLGLLNVRMDSYFATGNDLPAMPPLPSKLRRLLKDNETAGLGSRPVTEIQGGKGFAFGSSLGVNTGNLNFWVLYAKFESEIGFDIMMKKYKGVFCGGQSEVLGLNGWYATGQAYAYLYGAVGLRVKLFGSERHFTVLQGEVGAMLEAQLPRPAYFGGAFGLNFSVLGGLVRGNCRFKFSLGEKCEMVESGFADGLEVIGDMRPADRAADVDVFTVPQVAFNLPVGKELEAVFDGEDKQVRLSLDEYGLQPVSASGSAASAVSGRTEWDTGRQLARWVPGEALAPRTDYALTARIRAQEKAAGGWRDLQTIEGGAYTETRQHRFTTGDAPDSIPFRNIVRMYPVQGQRYVYTGERERGWVELGIGQAYLFDDAAYRKQVYCVDETGDTLLSSFSYNKADRRLNFRLPALKPSRNYTLQFVLTAMDEGAGASGGVASDGVASGGSASGGGLIQTETESRDGDNVLVQTKSTLSGDALQARRDKLILQVAFSTSRYATLADKLRALSFSQVYRVPYIHILPDGTYQPSPIVHYLQAEMRAAEGFDDIELHGSALSGGPLIEARAVLDDEPYYRRQIYPLVYEHYPYGGLVSFERNPEHPETVPDWAVYVSSYYVDDRTDFFPWMYYLPYHYHRDFESVLVGVAAGRSGAGRRWPAVGLAASAAVQASIPGGGSALGAGTPVDYGDWLNRPFPPMPAGIYPIRFVYRLPDGSSGSECEIIMKNEIQ